MKGIELIAKEREEQIIKHGRTIEKDYALNSGTELSMAASALIMFSDPDEDDKLEMFGHLPSNWSSNVSKKLINKSYKERLVIAGALIAAEIDRLNYIKSNEYKP